MNWGKREDALLKSNKGRHAKNKTGAKGLENE